jgi:hypothetical protein
MLIKCEIIHSCGEEENLVIYNEMGESDKK